MEISFTVHTGGDFTLVLSVEGVDVQNDSEAAKDAITAAVSSPYGAR